MWPCILVDAAATRWRRAPPTLSHRRKPGVPDRHTAEIRAVASQYGPAIIAKLAEMSGVVPGIPAESETVRVAAMRELLDRGYGRATQHVAGDARAAPIVVDFRWADPQPSQPAPEPIGDAGGIDVVFADAVVAPAAPRLPDYRSESLG